MKIDQVAIQLYTLRDHIQTPADISASLEKVAEIGYRAVQVSGMGPIPEEELMAITEREGLTICATHESGETILTRPETVVARLKKLNCKHTAYPWPAGIDFTSAEVVARFAKDLERAGKVLHDAGQVLSYHNHNNEFLRLGDRTVLDYLFDETDPEYLQAELDTYWVQSGGGDPVAWCEKLQGRLPVLHMKDYKMTAENKPTFAEVGAGNLNWKKIIAAADASGCQWFIVEQDTTPGDPFDSIRQSFEFIKANLV